MLVSKRLVLKQLTKKEVVPFYQNHRDPSLKHWIPNKVYQDLDEAAHAIEFFFDCVNKKKLPYVLGIFCKENKLLIGDIGMNVVDGTKYQIEIVEFVSEELKIMYLQGRVLKGNLGSQRVLEKMALLL